MRSLIRLNTPVDPTALNPKSFCVPRQAASWVRRWRAWRLRAGACWCPASRLIDINPEGYHMPLQAGSWVRRWRAWRPRPGGCWCWASCPAQGMRRPRCASRARSDGPSPPTCSQARRAGPSAQRGVWATCPRRGRHSVGSKPCWAPLCRMCHDGKDGEALLQNSQGCASRCNGLQQTGEQVLPLCCASRRLQRKARS